ncbi:MAG: glutamate formimidoyltransferase [Oscillospiraceae bacterium]|jgi:glutamate formiminotransferase
MSEKIVECVPNISCGNSPETVEKIADAVRRSGGCRLAQVESDQDHNRSVLTFFGSPENAVMAAVEMTRTAAGLIDLRTHRGVHPRIGAVDVIPFVPIRGMDMKEAAACASKCAELIWNEIGIPCYLYGEAARVPGRRNLADVRRGGFEGLPEKMKLPEWKPDFGGTEPHPTAGASAVGARDFLIAFNFELATDDVKTARRIASAIREKNGGLKGIKALGLYLASRNKAQVSVNVCSYRETPLWKLCETVEALAQKLGTEVTGTELIGLVPDDAMAETAAHYMKTYNFNRDALIGEEIKGL